MTRIRHHRPRLQALIVGFYLLLALGWFGAELLRLRREQMHAAAIWQAAGQYQATLLAQLLDRPFKHGNAVEVQQAVTRLAVLGGRVAVLIVSDTGQVLASSAGHRLAPDAQSDALRQRALQSDRIETAPADQPYRARYALPLADQAGRRTAVLIAQIDWEPDYRAVEREMQIALWRYGFWAIAGFLVLLLATDQLLLRPIRALQQLTRRVAAGDSSARLASPLPVAELTELGQSFHQMLASLESHEAELARMNAALEQMVAQRTAALQASEARYRAISSLSADYFYELAIDAQGRLRRQWVTSAFEQITGYQPAELDALGGWSALIHPDDQAAAEERGRRLRAGHDDARELRIRTRDGATRWVYDAARPLPDPVSGRVTQILGAVRDVTARKEAEAVLELRDRAMAAASCGILISDPHQPGNPVIYCNAAFERITGYTAQEVIGRNCRFLQAPDTDAAAIATMRAAIAEARPCQVTVKNLRKDGTPFWNQLTIAPVRDAAGRLTHFIGIQTDISERVQAEQALRASEARLNGILSSATDAIITVDAQQRIQLFNRAAEHLFGCLAEEVLGQTLDRFIPLAAREAHRAHVRAFQPSGTATRVMGHPRALTALRADGASFPIEAAISQITIGGQKLSTVILRDITERVRAEEERLSFERAMLQTQKLESLGVLAGGIAHDFNNLLATIQGNAELARAELPAAQPATDSIEQIALAARRAAELTGQLLAYAGKGHVAVTLLDINELIREMATLLSASIPEHVTLRYELDAAVPLIRGDSGQLRQVVMNLLVNAAEAIGERAGMVTVTTEAVTLAGDAPQGEDGVVLRVADTGCGMDAATQARIFEPFFTTKFTGRGLGLAAVQGIVQRHQGTLSIVSAPGMGTTISITLPASRQARSEASPGGGSASARPASAQGLPAPRGPILVVDDEPGVQLMVVRTLRRAGYTTLTADDGRAGAEQFRAHADAICCVLIDATMPELDGTSAAREMRLIQPNVPILLMSGYSAQELAERAASGQLAGFVQKPFSPAELCDVVQQVLDART